MKIPAFKNENIAVFSCSHHDCNGAEGIYMDGGVSGTSVYAGYNRFGGEGERCWIELPNVSFADIYNDYNESLYKPRKYGVHKLADIRILPPEEYQDTESFQWERENAIWGTCNVKGNQQTTYMLLVECSTDHLENILKNCHHISAKTIKIINSILGDRN